MSDPHHSHHTPQGPYDPVPNPYGQQPYGYPQPPADPYAQPPAYGQQPAQQPGYGYGYGQQPQPMPYPYQGPLAPPQNKLATASIVVGFISIFGLCIPFAGLMGPVALGMGIAALNRANRTGVGKNAAIGGIIVGSLSLLILIAMIIFYVTTQAHYG